MLNKMQPPLEIENDKSRPNPYVIPIRFCIENFNQKRKTST